jgi:hypothetical protein
MEVIKKIKQNGILFTAFGFGISGTAEFLELVELFEFTEPSKSALQTLALIVMALPFPFWIYDWIKALKKP